ncbi:MAG: alanine racemase [Tabrizicola sp.]|nr:alanine racemase [Tabrizicola sp.]
MATATLTIDLDAIAANWRALDRLTGPEVQTAAVVKADAYGLGVTRVARTLAHAGARRFFVAYAEEGAAVRQALGPGPQIAVLSGHCPGDTEMIHDLDLTPMLNSLEQITRHLEALPGHPFGVQLDTGMNRLGVDGTGLPRSLAATGGILLGSRYHFDLTRPGVGLYGGLPYVAAQPVVRLSLPVIQTREVEVGEAVGYGCTWVADRPATIATVAAGYADGLPRTLSNRARLWDGDVACPVVGRVSMDAITVDVSHLAEVPRALDILGPMQGVDALAELAGTIGYEMLTSLGARYQRRYQERGA